MEQYTSPQMNIDQIIPHRELAGGGVTTAYAQYVHARKTRIKGCKLKVNVAGTATTHIMHLYNGTTSVGNITISTESADVWFDVTLDSGADFDVTLGDAISMKTGVDAAGKVEVFYRLQDLLAD